MKRILTFVFVGLTRSFMRKYGLCLGMLLVMLACEPFDLPKKNFPVCAKPRADIGYSAGLLAVTLFLSNPQGDIGAVGWDPGDGKGVKRVGTRVTYTYDKAGTYTVSLVIANSCDDTFTTTQQITVHN